MTRKISYILCMCFIFVSCVVKADKVHVWNNIKINNILMYEYLADLIFKDARNKHIDIFDAKDESVKVDAVVKDADVIIRGSELMDEVTRLYNMALSNSDNRNITYEESEGGKVGIYVNKRKKLVINIMVGEKQNTKDL